MMPNTWDPTPEELQRFFTYLAELEVKKAQRHRHEAEKWFLRAHEAKDMEESKKSKENSAGEIQPELT